MSKGQKVFSVFNYIILALIAALCLLPIIHLLAVSLSAKAYAESNSVGLWPKGFTLDSYKTLITGKTFPRAFLISCKRTILGTAINVILTVMLAYPLSKPSREFRGRQIYIVLIMITMVFGGGLVPSYLLINDLHLMDTVWALVLPGAVNTFNVILMMNFMRGIPKEIEEAAFIDGADYFNSLTRVVLPVSKASIATVTLFSFVGHWNSWFDGLIYNLQIKNYPLQTYLQVVLSNKAPAGLDEAIIQSQAGGRTLRSAQIFVTMLPLLLVYPFAQKYFVTGIVLGSVKG